MKANMKTKSRAIKSAPLQLFKGKTSGRQDTAFLILVLLISAFGSIMVFSAGGPYAQARYGDENTVEYIHEHYSDANEKKKKFYDSGYF